MMSSIKYFVFFSNPLLFGFSNSVLTVHVDNDTYKANIHLVIPQASLTGKN